MAQKEDSDAKAVKNQLDFLQESLEIANESGLLKEDSEAYEKIIDNIGKALQDLSNKNPRTIEARKKFSLAFFQFNKAINSTSFWWRFKYAFGGPVLLYLLSVSIAIFLSWILLSPILLDSKMLWVPSWAYLWGAIGGTLQGFWWLWQHIWKRQLRKYWFTWYVILPLLGAILGALTYLVFFAGFIAATGQTQITSEFFVILLCALAGFSTKWAVEILDKLTTLIHVGK